ncbi:MAG TPA: TolC family protein [Thermoanaerobaculia bacterium]|jgi:HAE1 family hydrophobic/amphiphilic exporter-1
MRRLLLMLALATTAGADELTVEDAVALALARNPDVVVERESVHIADATILRAEAAYEPSLRGDARLRERTDPVNSILSGAPQGELGPTTRTLQTSASFVQLLPTGGTVSLFSGLQRDATNSILSMLTPAWSTLFGAEVRQPLLQNRRIDPARRAIRLARVDRTRALSSLERMASEVTAAVEKAYWTAASARREVEIREASLRTAEKQRDDTRVRIEAGTQAEAELASTTAEIERRRGELAIARENRTRAENVLRGWIGRWQGDLQLSSPLDRRALSPSDDGRELSPEAAVQTAFRHRPELRELQSRVVRQDVELDAALDRVRPQVDLVASYSGRGLAGTRNADAIEPFGPIVIADEINGGLGRSLRSLDEFPDAALGVSFVLPIGNTAAKQDVAIARAVRRQAEASVDALKQRIAVEVRNAIAAVASAEQRIAAARAMREAAEVQLQAERDRFDAGTTNLFFIITRQNELAAAELAESIALIDARRAESELARATGTLLEARSISIDGGQQ